MKTKVSSMTEEPSTLTLTAIVALARRGHFARHTLKLGMGSLNTDLHDHNDRAPLTLPASFVDEISYVISKVAA